MAMVYQWKPGTPTNVDPQAAGEEMERIRVRQNGRLEAPDLVREARRKSSPLHPIFEWDDRTAAEKWRVEQAGYFIRHLTVVIDKGDDEPPAPVRAFVSVVRDEDRSYTSIQHALSDEDLRAQVLAQALMELEAWRHRHAELVELAKIFAAIDQARGAT